MRRHQYWFHQVIMGGVILTTFRYMPFFLLFLFLSQDLLAEQSMPLLIKGDNNYPPYEYLNEKNEPDGFNVDIMRAVAREMGLSIHIEMDTWSIVRAEIENGQIDALMGMFNTKERGKLVDFSIPHFIAYYSVFVQKGSNIKSLEDARRKRILVQKGDLGHDYLVENNISDSLLLRDTINTTLNDLSKGLADCAVVSRLQGMIILKDEKIENIIAVGPPIIQRKYCIAVTKGNGSLLAKLNEGLSIIKTTGEYEEIYNKWFGVYENQNWEKEKILKYIIWIACPLVLIIFFALFWSWSLKKTVLKRTKALEDSEEELRNARNYICNIIDSMPSMLIGIDANVNVTQWNKSAELNTGITTVEATGKKLVELLPELVTDLEKINESIQAREIKKELNKCRNEKNGDIHYENITIYPLIANCVEGAVIQIDDVTKEHKLEEQLLQSRKMDAIGQLAAGVAHDFNNLLAGIMGAAELLRYQNNNLDENGTKYVDMILQISERATTLTSKLLTFGRQASIVSGAVDVNAILEDTIDFFSRTLDKIIVVSLRKEATNSIIIGDKSGLQSAFLNIGINASHAMLDGGEIQIVTKNIELDTVYCDASTFDLTPGEFIEIEIRDSGTGIPEKHMHKIFEPFFTTKEPDKGTGLGLAAVYGTVQEHHGSIDVYSEVGKGTVFHMYLPCSEEIPHPKGIEHQVITGTGKILLVDDEEINRITGKYMLEKMGYEVILAVNGLEAVEIFGKLHSEIDLVLTDMIMPEMNGKDTFYKMKVIDSSCKVIVASGFTKDESLVELRESGLAGFIQKPFRDYALSRLLAEVLNK